ncbi:hypothetical protein FNV43_RR00448 [Rhamnella rubrinervis]|uniref:TIR domain-containing protein n=1 Tax=Rhamnella rubrinervis TaxID=2594499 RepID=A0A8K0HMU5_9ROSA|nr:hypothetical protein FNV43_RR00448 [Rhamnella rubrinervis]
MINGYNFQHILDYKKRNGQIVMPIFYGIDHSIVRKQERSYEAAFAKLEERFKDRMENVLQWRDALTQASNICGLDSKDFRITYLITEGRLFAIQERVEKIENLLDIECSTDVRIVVIWGLSYVWNVRQQYEHLGPNNLRKELLTQNSYPTEYYETLSRASYADGNPLALKVLGSFLHTKSEEKWESALEKLKRVPNNDILNVLRISYLGLDDEGIKNIFLDIACFFDKPFTREYAESILDGGDSSAKIGISVLIDMSLLEVSHKENYFRMHDLIRLFHVNDGCHVLEKSTWDFYPLESLPSDFTRENLVELILRRSHLKQLENHVVKSLPKLKKMDLSNSKLFTRIADLSQAPNLESINLEGCTSLIHVLSSFQNLHKLAHLHLNGCNKLRELVEISGKRGHLDIVQNLSKSICHLNFTLLNSYITDLITNFPLYSSSLNISLNFPMNLTSLNLSETTIEVVPSSIYCLLRLRTLDLHCCEKLKSLSTSICILKYLQEMYLCGCSNLVEFPEILEPMEHLNSIDLSATAIKKLPESIGNLSGLTTLHVQGCEDIEYLPNNLCKLSRLF